MTSTIPRGNGTTTIAADDPATRAFSRSMLISATRCLLTYILFPWVLPLLGVTAGVGPALGLPIGAVAVVSNVFTIRRFWASDHRWKWPVTVICLGVLALLVVLIGQDIAELL